jgi:hypothetical protein
MSKFEYLPVTLTAENGSMVSGHSYFLTSLKVFLSFLKNHLKDNRQLRFLTFLFLNRFFLLKKDHGFCN